jgi:hypothetical protein
MKEIPLGYEVGTGKPVAIPCRHMVVTGQTQEAGKTTTLEALIARSGLPAVAFVTKRGEQSFSQARRITPYFRERADWQFVASVLEATMRERLKFERAWIMRASKGARTLADVQRNVRRLADSAKGLSADVYMTLDAYLEIVVPRIASVRFAERVELAPGLNALDVSDRDNFPPELQSLVMRSVLEWVYERENGVITIIPEAWEFIPQGRGSPVKLAAVELIRKGAGLKNYVWLDSQDIGGVDKEMLRSCPVWLLGVQREANEIKRVLDNIPAGIAKPKPADVATLERGQFFACFGRHVIKTYVQPEWMSGADARAVATEDLEISDIPRPEKQTPKQTNKQEDKVTVTEANALREENAQLREQLEELKEQVRFLTNKSEVHKQAERPNGSAPAGDVLSMIPGGPDLYQSILKRILKEPAILGLRTRTPEMRVSETREVIEVDGTTLRGRIAKLILGGFLDTPVIGADLKRELTRTGAPVADPNLYRELDKLVELGFLTNEGKGVGFKVAPDMKRNVRKT